jgi:hypothetical protein
LLDGAPDIYFKILNGNNNVIFESGYYDGLTLNQLPVNYTSDLPFTIENAFNQRCTIEFWDYDNDFDGDEWMGGYYFTPSQQDFNKNVIHLQSSTSDLELKMYVTWLE